MASAGQLSRSAQKPSPSASSSAALGQRSQTLPAASPSVLAWSVFTSTGQLSLVSRMVSLSLSSSQASPPSVAASVLSWLAFETDGQLSVSSRMPSLSESGSGMQTSPTGSQ